MTRSGPLVRTFEVGRLTVHAIEAGGQKLDGGAMFGVVPKPLWQRRIAPDERNRIPLSMRCLLVEHPDGLVLVDTGAGNKEDPKFHDIYGLENRGTAGATALEDGIIAAGHRPEDVAFVIDTHLHFDHAGGNTRVDDQGVVQLAFPNASYFVQAGEYEYAKRPNERTSASYFARNFVPVREAGRLELIDGTVEVVSGITAVPTPGHTPHHQSVLIESEGERAFYFADLVPTHAHLPLPWIMGYDVEPLVTLETKRRILAQAVAEQWLVVFEHDWEVPWGRVVLDGKNYALAAGG